MHRRCVPRQRHNRCTKEFGDSQVLAAFVTHGTDAFLDRLARGVGRADEDGRVRDDLPARIEHASRNIR